ncbi:MAG: hypothetical protein HZA53_03615 [Planctomycetes bacterium]|nr:hypothetical protein [Planctomycetota bacterium]
MVRRTLLSALFVSAVASALTAAQEPPVEQPLSPREQKDLERLAARPKPTEFELAVEVARTRIAAARDAKAAELAQGALASVVMSMEAAVPARATNAAEALALGNALFVLDPAAARAAHAKAYELLPAERGVLAAWGRELHREGRLAEAARAYQGALDANHPDALVLHGLRAAALLRAGAIEEALAAWDQCSPFQARADLETALREIHRRGDKEEQRRALLARAHANEPEAFERLIVLDLAWKGEDPYPLSNRPYVAADLALAAEKYGKDARRYVELEFLANGRMGMEPRPKDAPAPSIPEPQGSGAGLGFALPPSVVEKTGRKLGFLGFGKDKKQFPVSSVLAPAIYKMLFLDGDVVSTEWVGWFDAELRKRAASEAGDIDAALLLIDLYEETLVRKFDGWEKYPEKLAEWHATTWGRYKDARVAQRLLAWKGKDLAPDDPVLKEALERFPDDKDVVERAVEAARRSGGKVSEALLVASARAALNDENVLDANRHLVELKLTREKQKEADAPKQDGKSGAPR